MTDRTINRYLEKELQLKKKRISIDIQTILKKTEEEYSIIYQIDERVFVLNVRVCSSLFRSFHSFFAALSTSSMAESMHTDQPVIHK